MPIKGITEKRQMPRLGKIRTGIKVPNKSGNGEHPEAVDHFVLPDEIAEYFGEKPKSLPIMFPVEDESKFASQYYKSYSSFRGLVCKGNGETCWRLIDTKTGDFAHREAVETVRKEMPCSGRDCQLYEQKKCKEVMNLQFLLPSVPGLGVWQLDTSSYHSIIAINSAIELIRNMCGRISMIPLRLTIEPREVSPDGKKKIVNILQIRADITLAEIQKLGALPGSQVMLPPPDEDKPELLFEDVEAEIIPDTEQAKKDIDESWPEDNMPEVVKVKPETEKDFEQIESASSKQQEAVTDRDPATITDWGRLFTACKEDYNLSRTEVLTVFNAKTINDLTDTPAECYKIIIAKYIESTA